MHDGAVGSRVAREAPGTLSRAVVLAGCVLAVAGCGGGGGGGGPATTTLSGTAAVGAPLTGAATSSWQVMTIPQPLPRRSCRIETGCSADRVASAPGACG